jgi:PPIC-type PPIASE domain
MKPRTPEEIASADPKRVVAIIDGKPITAADAVEMLRPFPPEQRKQYESNLPNLIQQVYTREQLADAAKKLSLEQQSPWKEQIDLSRNTLLTQAYLAHVSETAAKGAAPDPQAYYNAHPGDFDTIKLSGIIVAFSAPGTPAGAPGAGRTEQQAHDKADDLVKKLKTGGDFTALASAESDNQGSAAKGGDLGTYKTGDPNIPPAIKAAVVKLQPAQISEPVRIPNGYLILRLDNRTKASFDEARSGIVQRLQTETGQAAVKQLVDKYKIEVKDPDFFNAGSGSAKIPSLARPGDAPTPGQPAPKPQP